MGKLKLFFACLLMAFLSIGQVWATDATWSCTIGSGNNFGSATNVTTNPSGSKTLTGTVGSENVAKSWDFTMVSGTTKYYLNNTQIGSGTNYCTSVTLSTSAFTQTIKNVKVTSKCGSSATATITVKVGGTKYVDAESLSTTETVYGLASNTGTSTGDIEISISQPSTKKAVYISKIEVIYDAGGDADPVLQSIAVSGTPSTKTYEEGDLFDVAGLVVTGTYDKGDPQTITENITWEARTSSTSGDAADLSAYALTQGQTALQVRATVSSISSAWTDVTGLTITEHVVTPGEYEVLLSNTLWGVTSGQQAAGVTSMSGEANDISFTTTKGSSQMYASGTQTRFYANSTLTISVPTGYAITSVVFAEPTSDTKWDGSISVDNGEYTAGTKTWEGEENSVTFTFGAQNRAASATVTYKVATADAPSVTIDPTSINATESAASGTIDATYTNVTLANVTVGRYNDEACTEDFTGGWLTAALNSDKDIEYTINANTGEARTAYIKLTAPASNGTSPDVVKVIEVAQARAVPTYTSLSDLFDDAVAADAIVKIVFDDCVISGKKDDNTAYLTDKDNTYGLVIYTTNHGFNVGDVLNGTVQTTLCKYNGNSELKGLASNTEGLTVTTGGTITSRVVDPTALTGANAGSVITINGSCTVASSKYYVNGVQLYNTLYDFENPTEGNQYNCTGVFLMYNSTKEILPRSVDDIEEVAIPTAVINLDDVVLEEGKSTTLSATITPAVAASAEVTYSIIDGDSYISLSGAVLTATAKGTAHIRATVADDLPNYYGVTKEIEVTVTEVDPRYKAEQTGFTEISGALTTVTEGTHKNKNYITYEAKKGASSTVPGIYDTDKIRIYQNGGLMVIGAVKGCKIDQVFITTGGSYNSTTIGYSTSETSIATTGDAVAKNTIWNTPEGLNTDSVVIVCLGNDKNTRIDVAKLDVRYTGDPATVSSIALSGTYQTEFEVDAVFDHTGLVVTATYSDASEADVTALAEFSIPDMSTIGSKTITVSFGGKSTTYDIEVVAATLSSIALSGTYPTTFEQGAAFDHTGMVVTATYSDASEVNVTADATFSGYSMSGAGVQTVTVAYGGKEATYKITVVPANTDVITASGIGAEGSSYADWSAKSFNTSAVYAGHSYAPNTDAIQIRTSQSKEGIVVTTQNETKVVKSVVVNFATEPTNSRVLQVYGKHSVYTSAADLFDTEKQGTLIGTLAASGTLDCTAADYEFIGLRSSEGAMYLACVMVTWGDATPEPPTPEPGNYVRDDSWMAPGELGTVCISHGATFAGANIYELVGKEANGGVVFASVTTMEPGKPYLFQATANRIDFYYTTDPEAGAAGSNKGMHGTFEPLTITTDLANTYYFAGHTLWSSVDLTEGGLSIPANRAYVKMSEVPTVSPNQAPGRHYIVLGVHGENGTTAIDEVINDQKANKVMIDGHLFILRGEKTYDATGRLVK